MIFDFLYKKKKEVPEKKIVKKIPEKNEDGKLLQDFWIINATGCQHQHWGNNPQEVIPNLKIGERVYLYADTENKYDNTAIAIFDYQNKFIGWYPSKAYMAENLFARLRNKEKVFSNIVEILEYNFRMNIGVYAYEGESLKERYIKSESQLLEKFPEMDERGYTLSSNALANVYGVSKHYDGFPAQQAIDNLEIYERVFLGIEEEIIYVYTQTGKRIGYTMLSKKSDEILKAGGTVLARVERLGVNEVGIKWISIRVASYSKF